MSFAGLLIVCAVAFLAPLALGLVPRLRLPAVVLEIVAGIVVGPSVLGWVAVDEPIRVLSMIGLAFLLFLAGLELNVTLLRGRRLTLTLVAFGASAMAALAVGFLLKAGGMVESALLVAIILTSTALGVIAPVLKDAGESASEFGQLIIAAASIADFGTILFLSVLFSQEAGGPLSRVVLLGAFGALAVVVAMALSRAGRSASLGHVLLRLQDSTAQIRIRGAFLLLVALAAMAGRLGLEVILGAFVAGALLSILDADYAATHPRFHEKLAAIGFGVFVPVFFVTSGIEFDLRALFADGATIARIPVFLAALVAVRGLPAIIYVPLIGRSRAVVAGLLQATSLPFIVAGTSIGLELGLLTPSNASALVAAGLLSVVIFPTAALALLRRAPAPRGRLAV